MSVMTTTGSVDYDQAAYDRMAYFSLRPELYFDPVADVQPTRQSMPGTSVTFTIQADLAVASTAINESVDVDAVALSTSQKVVTLLEYGNSVQTSAKLRGTSFIELDPVVANVVGFNAGVSIDTVARDVLKGGSNASFAGSATSRAEIVAADILSGANVRRVVAQLRSANVATIGGLYVGFIHPDVSYDFRGGTADGNWRDPHIYSQPGEIWNGEIGAFEGVRFIETPRAPIFADGGSGTVDAYGTIILGRQGLAKAFSVTDGNGPFAKVVAGPVTDKLRRFVPMGWYWLGGYARFREEALRRIESSSSIGANA